MVCRVSAISIVSKNNVWTKHDTLVSEAWRLALIRAIAVLSPWFVAAIHWSRDQRAPNEMKGEFPEHEDATPDDTRT
jgi:hypothetical protein